MIGYIRGTLLEQTEKSCLVLTAGGVGYELRLTLPALARLPAEGQEVSFHTELVVREDSQDLYGFETSEERRLFHVLLSIPNLGPKKGLAILSQFHPDDLRQIVLHEDIAALTRVSGIGKKTGQQILWELKYKLASAETPVAGRKQAATERSVLQDALAGLANLGYSEEEARPILQKIFEAEPDLDVAQLLREALKAIAKARA